jgi:hypothetical protein
MTLPFKQLLNIYKTYLHSLYPFINLSKLLELVELRKFDNPLLIAVILRAQQFQFSLNLAKGESVPRLEDFSLYHLLIAQLKIQSSGSRNIALCLVQAYAILTLLELNEDLLVAGSVHLTQAITLGTQLNLDSWMEQVSDMMADEKASTWLFLQYLEQFYLLCTRKPKIIRYKNLMDGIIDLKSDSINLEGSGSDNSSSKDEDSTFLLKMNYPNIHNLYPTTLSSNLNILTNYHHYIYFSKNLLKIKKGFNPQLVTIKEINKLGLMRTELKEIISKKFAIRTNEGKAERFNLNHFKLLGFGYLLNYCLFAIILLDVTELLILYHYESPKIKHKLELDQRKLSLYTIDLLIPSLIGENLDYSYINKLDALIPQTLFHCLSPILKPHYKINLAYYKSIVLELMQANKYFGEGTINIEHFLKGFEKCQILRKVNRMVRYEQTLNN